MLIWGAVLGFLIFFVFFAPNAALIFTRTITLNHKVCVKLPPDFHSNSTTPEVSISYAKHVPYNETSWPKRSHNRTYGSDGDYCKRGYGIVVTYWVRCVAVKRNDLSAAHHVLTLRISRLRPSSHASSVRCSSPWGRPFHG